MRLGIRAQLLVAIAGLLLLALGPLFFAIASLARASQTQAWERQAEALGRAIAGHVTEARLHRDDEGLDALLEVQVGGGVGAIAIYDEEGSRLRLAGDEAAKLAVPEVVPPQQSRVVDTRTARGAARLVVVPGAAGPVATLLYTDPQAVRVGPLVRLVAFYIGLLGLGLLVFAYLVLTRLVVLPLEELRRAASRVAEGDRELRGPSRGASELLDLGDSLRQMTAALRAEEAALKEQVEALERAQAEIERTQQSLVRSERLASVGRLAAGLAHEIGNPVAAILSFQELLLDGNLEEEDREFVERMRHETERVNRIIRDLLDFARPHRRREPEDAEATADVAEAVEQVRALVKPQRAFADISLDVEVAPELPRVTIAPGELEQLLVNLLLNAADAIGGPGRVSVEVKRDDDRVRLAVEDDGPGIAPSIRDALFEPFVTTKDVGSGTGLGLAVCRGLVEAAGGTIDVVDRAHGARFEVALPAVPAVPAVPAAPASGRVDAPDPRP